LFLLACHDATAQFVSCRIHHTCTLYYCSIYTIWEICKLYGFGPLLLFILPPSNPNNNYDEFVYFCISVWARQY